MRKPGLLCKFAHDRKIHPTHRPVQTDVRVHHPRESERLCIQRDGHRGETGGFFPSVRRNDPVHRIDAEDDTTGRVCLDQAIAPRRGSGSPSCPTRTR